MLSLADLHPGMRVRCAAWHGVVMFNSLNGEYAEGYPATAWQHLGAGCMIDYVEAGLVFHHDLDEDHSLDDGGA